MEKQLNVLLSNLAVMHVKLHHHHWFVSGAQFYTLHETFQTLYEEMSSFYDEVAERMIMTGSKPLSSMQAYLKHHTLKEAEDILPPLDMVKTIVSDFKVISTLCHTLIVECEQSNDFVSADLLIKIKGVLDKHVWMLGAMLK